MVEKFKSMHSAPFFFVSFGLILVCYRNFFCLGQVLLIAFSFLLNEFKHLTWNGQSWDEFEMRWSGTAWNCGKLYSVHCLSFHSFINSYLYVGIFLQDDFALLESYTQLLQMAHLRLLVNSAACYFILGTPSILVQKVLDILLCF